MEYFIHPEHLWHLCWVVPFVVILYLLAQYKRKRAIRQLLGQAHFIERNIIGVNLSPAKRFTRFLMILCAAIFLVVTYATPTWGKKVIPISGAGRDIMVALDLSKSMWARDLPPNRLAQAKLLINELTQKMKGDRFGLVSFAGRPMMVCPLTFDRVSFMQILQSQDMNTIPLGGTDLEKALALCSKHLEETQVGHRAILLITDGGELTGSLLAQAEKLKAQKMPVVVVGVGDPLVGSPIQIPDGKGGMRFVEDENRQVVNSKLMETPLRQLAQETGGVYIHSTLTDLGVNSAMHYLQQLTPTAHDESSKTLPIERTTYFLALSLLCLIVWFLIGETQKMQSLKEGFVWLLRSKVPLILIGSFFALNISAQENNVTQSRTEEIYNQGVRLHNENHVDSAQERYETAIFKAHKTPAIKAASSHNLGTIYHQKARDLIDEATTKAQQETAASLKLLEQAEKSLNEGEGFYRESLGDNMRQSAQNQRILLKDRKNITELRQIIKQLEEEMKKSAEQTQQAQQDQQQANQQQQQAQQEQNQDKKQQAQQQQQQAQQNASQKTQNAKESVEKMQDAAEKLNNQDMKDKAEAIKNQLEKAQESQEKGDGKKAEEHLKNASQQLKQEAQKAQDQQEKADQEAKDQESKDKEEKNNGQEQGEGKEDLSKQGEKEGQTTNAEPKEDKDLSESAAASILREMAKEEAQAREKILKKNQGKEPAPLRDY